MERLSDDQLTALAKMESPLTPRGTIKTLCDAIRDAYEKLDRIRAITKEYESVSLSQRQVSAILSILNGEDTK